MDHDRQIELPAENSAHSENAAPPKNKKSGGPRTPPGKLRSSQNALKHGCRSEKLILRDEDPAAFEALRQDWLRRYLFRDPIAVSLVEQTVRADWFSKRASRRLEEIEWELPANAYHWTEEHQRLYATFSRYKVTAERTFLRFYKELERLAEQERREQEAEDRALLQRAKVEMKWVNKLEQRTADQHKLAQWVEVEVLDGRTKTTSYPSNAQLREHAAGRPTAPLFVTRWVRFADGVPPEYGWLCPDDIQQSVPATAVQKFWFRDWLRASEREDAAGHLLPILPDRR